MRAEVLIIGILVIRICFEFRISIFEFFTYGIFGVLLNYGGAYVLLSRK